MAELMRYLISYGTEPPVALDVDQDYVASGDEQTDEIITKVRNTATRLAQWYAMEHHAPARVDWQEYAFLPAQLVIRIQAV